MVHMMNGGISCVSTVILIMVAVMVHFSTAENKLCDIRSGVNAPLASWEMKSYFGG